MVTADPVANLGLLNDALLNEPGVAGRFCTVVYARLTDIGAGGIDLELATGGHLPPRILGPGGELRRLDLRGAIVGGLREPRFGACATRLAPGETLVLFTDGVTELRGHDPGLGETRLDELLRRMPGERVGPLVDGIVRQAVDLQGGEPRDDVAVIALRARA
jgi:serine phosphatase RsbU (regulator of sigma subunit)